MNVISAVILAVLAVIGASTVIKAFTQWLFRVREDCSVLLITPVDSAENAEMVLRSAASRLKWGEAEATARSVWIATSTTRPAGYAKRYAASTAFSG